jgi:hypothetical protein
MNARSLFDPVIDGGIRNPNWFEGRLLTADALRDKDRAERLRERLLGRAIGAGIFEGLMVTRSAADSGGVRKTLNITKGAAINGDGDVLMLSQDVTVDVVPPTTPAQPEPKLFGRCEPPPPIASIPSGFGIYVLVMSPASGYRERAPKSGLGSEGIVTGCGDAFAVDGVRFRLEKLEPANISGIDAAARDELTTLIAHSGNDANRSLLRNLIAHYCFGTPELARFSVDPFAISQGVSDWAMYGALDDLRDLGRLTSRDIPVAVLLWNEIGAALVDMWSARLPPTPAATTTDWPLIVERRRTAIARARFLQFQHHAAEIGAVTALSAGDARNAFRYLPSAGVLPLAASPGAAGFDRTKFFAGCTIRRPAFINGACIFSVLEQSFTYPAMQLSKAWEPPGSELIWLYLVYENAAALDGLLPGPAAQGVMLFANGNMPFAGNAHFDVARWNYANFSAR